MRLPGWETRLSDEMDRARGLTFAWGTHDCATWAFDVRRALTGEDAAAAWRGRYGCAFGAARMVRRLGCDSIEGLARKFLGAPMARIEAAKRGDIVLAAEDDALGVCVGADALFLSPVGLTPRPMSKCRLAWGV